MKKLAKLFQSVPRLLLFLGIFLFISGCKSEARSSLKCPKPCKKECKFKATLSGTKDPKACGGKGGYKTVEVMTFKESPKDDECVADLDREPKGTTGYIKWKLCDDTECKLTSEYFPDGNPMPFNPNQPPANGLPPGKKMLSKKCYNSFTTGGTPEGGGGYTYGEIKSLELDYDIVTFCSCGENKNEGTMGFKDALK